MVAQLLDRISSALAQAGRSLWGAEHGELPLLQQIDQAAEASQRLLRLQEAAATEGARFMLAHLRASRAQF